jgi:GntR family transcriptional repressor for pyruvate dehydrogenase complex
LQARDADGARTAVEQHLGFVEDALANHKQAERHEAIAKKRFKHELKR